MVCLKVASFLRREYNAEMSIQYLELDLNFKTSKSGSQVRGTPAVVSVRMLLK